MTDPCIETGHCAQTGNPVERRAEIRREMDHIINDVERQNRHIGELLTFKNLMVGIAILGGIVFLGNYVYTYTVKVDTEHEINDHKDESEREHALLTEKDDALREQLFLLSTEIRLVDQKYIFLGGKIESLSMDIKNLTKALSENKKITKVKLMEDENEHTHEDDYRLP